MQFFSQWGKVTDSFVAVDKMSGRSKGFGFVTFATDEEASNACKNANGKDLDGRTIKVDIATPMEARPAGGGFGNNRSRSGGGGRREGGGGRY